MKFSKRYFYAGAGIFLGLGAPAAHVFLHMLQNRQGFWVSLAGEVGDHGFLLSLVAPFMVGIFGFVLGLLEDKIFSQKVQLERLAAQFERQSMTDDLTGLYNHRHILAEIDREVERANRYGRRLTGMMIDIDDFKKVNDQHGHLTGDCLLKEVSHLLRQSIRKVDILGRYGGDEFLVILPETTLEAAQVVAERIQKNINKHPLTLEGRPFPVTVSIGLSSFQDFQKIDTRTFIEKTDGALLQAKKSEKKNLVTG